MDDLIYLLKFHFTKSTPLQILYCSVTEIIVNNVFKKKKKAASSMLHEAKIAYYALDAAILFATRIGSAVAKAT